MLGHSTGTSAQEDTYRVADAVMHQNPQDCWLLGIIVAQGKESGVEFKLPYFAATETIRAETSENAERWGEIVLLGAQ